jgi:8-oxo-dGTP pyrophosphatase MutT (NUDIX family)
MSLDRFKPGVTVGAIIEKDGKFLLVEEHTSQGLRLNNPAGHLEPAEDLLQGCTREVLEETAFDFTPTALLGVYLTSYPQHNDALHGDLRERPHYLRLAFVGELGAFHPERALDAGIVRTLWLTPEEIRLAGNLRSPTVLQCMEDYLRGQRHSLALLHMVACD